MPVVPPLPPSLSEPTRSAFMLCSAGAMPNKIPAVTTIATANSSTWLFRETSASAGRSSGGIHAFRPSINAQPRATPTAPPIPASKTLSVRNCLTRRARPAPNAERTATSRSRPAPRTRRRLARLTQPMRRTAPTAARSTRRGRRRSLPTMRSS